MKTLVIVESPTKAKTISSFLPSQYLVRSSYGHVRDLPKSKLGIDVEHNFEPSYTIPTKAKEHVRELKKDAKTVDQVILATDEDREGEAIAWHIAHILEDMGSTKKQTSNIQKEYKRIAFHEITKEAILKALEHPRGIDMNLVNAQQARRVLDRLVGYELSPFLWRKIRYGLSAGRVQSVALRFIIEREREIEAFTQEEYWSIQATCLPKDSSHQFTATLHTYEGAALRKMDITSKERASSIVDALSSQSWRVASVQAKEVQKHPAPPFITSTLQQEAARKLGYSAKQTMTIAQKLYEQGHITYMRTDSTNLSSQALSQARHVIGEVFGSQYQLSSPRVYKKKSKGAQEAHEAIRPTNLAHTPDSSALKDKGQKALYALIWKRTLASQMQAARVEQTSVDITNTTTQHILRASGQVILFDGFMRVYTESKDDATEEDTSGTLPPLKEDDAITVSDITPLQHFTQPPARYSDATLVKALEAHGIGRPSTYAPTISTLQERGYVEKVEKRFHPTEVAFLVVDMLVTHFPDIIDVDFTAQVEENLDDVAEGKEEWTKVCKEFYEPFKERLEKKEKEVEKQVEVSDTPCPHCGKPMLIKFGRMGKFLACPEGEKVTLPMPEEAAQIKELEEKTKDEKCPECGSAMDVKRGRFGFFLACSRYPECKGTSRIWDKTGFLCPACKDNAERADKPGDIVLKKSRGRGKPFYACTRWPDCQFITNKKPESEEELQELYIAWQEKEKEDKKKPKKKTSRKKSSSKKK